MENSILDNIIDMDEKSAVKCIELCYGYRTRIVSRDDTNYIITMDYRLDRVNLYIKDGKVSKYDIG